MKARGGSKPLRWAERTYFSTFAAGLGGPVACALAADLEHFRPVLALEGFVAYETSTPIDRLRALPYVANTFRVLAAFDGTRPMTALIADALAQPDIAPRVRASFGPKE